MVKQTFASLIQHQRKQLLNHQRAQHQSRMRQQNLRCRTSADYRHKRMP